MKIFEKFQKIIFIILPIFIFLSGVFLVKHNLPKIVEIILKVALGPTISSQEIKFPKFGEIDISNVILSDEGKVIVKAPKVVIIYSEDSLKKFRLKEIVVKNPWVNIVRTQSKVNIVEAFSTGSKGKAGTGVPIDIIKIENNGQLLYTDKSYSREINQELKNVNGYVSFNKETGIDLNFKGNKEEEFFEYSFNNLKQDYDMNINLKDVQINSNLIQYGYDDSEISEASGVFNMNLNISPTGLVGKADLKNGIVTYNGLNSKVKNINGNINFDTDKILVNFIYNLKENPGKFDVFYSQNTGVKVNFRFKNLPYLVAEDYKLLGSLNLPLETLEFKSLDVELLYNAKTGFKAEVLYDTYPLKNTGAEINNLNGRLEFKDGILILTGKELELLVPSLNFKKNLNYKVGLDLMGKDLKFQVDSNFIDLNGVYLKTEDKIKIYQNSKLVMVYNLKKQELELLDLSGKNLVNSYKFILKAKENNKVIDFEEIGMYDENEKKVLNINGKLYKEKFKYNFNIEANDFEEKGLFTDLNLDTTLNFAGQIAGEKDRFILRGFVENLKLENKDILLESYANISLIKDEEIQANIEGELKEGKYKNFKIQGVKVDSTYKDGKLLISDIRNALFKLNGEVDIFKKYVDLQYHITGLKSTEFKKTNIVLSLDNVLGRIKGNFKELEANALVKEANLVMPNDQLVSLEGEITYKDTSVSTSKFKVNQSLASINYNLSKKNGDFTFNILENNLSKYYDFKALKYRILSRVTGTIIDGNLEAQAGINIDRVYLNGNILPNIISNIVYKKNSEENNLKIVNLDVFNLEGKKLLFSKGEIDLMLNNIKFEVPKQKLYLRDFKEIIDVNDMSGSIDLDANLSGELLNPKYDINFSKGTYEIKGFIFDKINLKLIGDKEKIDIEEFLAYYKKNSIVGKGNFNIKSQEYIFNIFSKNIDLKFLNAILSKDNLKDINGTANIDLQLSSDLNKNRGYIDFINLNANLPKALLELKNLDMILKIDNQKITIDSLKGKLNQGEINGTGYLELPTIDEIKADDQFYKDLNYKFNLTLKNAIYELKDYFRIDLSTTLNYSKNQVSGIVSINNGEITGILKEDKGLILTIVNFIIDKTMSIIGQSKKLGEEFEIKNDLSETPKFNVSMLIRDGIKINIPDVSTFAQDIKGTLLGRANLVGQNEKISILGELEIQNGSFVLGSEDFTVTRALLLTDKKNGMISAFNPNLIFDVSSLTSNGNVEISLQGELNSLRLNIITNQGSESSSLKNLFDKNGEENNKNAVALLFKTLIDSQISSTLLRPISRTIQNIFHISKFRIVSDVFNQEVLANSDNPRVQDPNAFGLGAYLEAENPIYKQKYFWVLKLGIIDGSKYDIGGNEGENQTTDTSNSVSQLDFKVERRYKSGWSYGVGVSKLNDENMIEKKKKGKLNYYVDFKFERKYNSIKDIFSK